MNLPLVSVIIPTYKRANYLNRAIDSVLKQTYKNIEIIVVDDNSPDSKERISTKKLISEHITTNKIKYIELDNNYGGAIARNKGLELAAGKYVCFLDDDDEFLEKKIELQVDIFNKAKDELAVVGGFANILDEKMNLIRIEKTEIVGNVFTRQLSKNICTTSIAMINKEIVIRSGGFEKIPSSQEHLFFLKIFNVSPYYDYVPEVVVNIHHHLDERISTNPNKPKGAIELFNRVQQFTEQINEEDIREITHCHLINISRAYISVRNKKEALKYLRKVLVNDKRITKDSVKVLLSIVLGYTRIQKLRTVFNKCNNNSTRGNLK